MNTRTENLIEVLGVLRSELEKAKKNRFDPAVQMGLQARIGDITRELKRLKIQNPGEAAIIDAALQGKTNPFDQYQAATARTANKFDDPKTEMTAWAFGLAGESGEFVDNLKKHLFHGHPLNVEDQAKELGDILYYVARSADALGYSLSEIAEMNINKLKARYPDGFDENKSMNREEGGE